MSTTMGTAAEDPPEISPAQQGTALSSTAWLPIPVLLVTLVGLWAADLPITYQSRSLTIVLAFIFSTMTSLIIVYLVARSFLAQGTPGLLLLGCGVAFWAASGVIGNMLAPNDANMGVTIHNSCAWLSGACHLAGVLLSLRPQQPLRARVLWFGATLSLAAGVAGLVAILALSGWLPTFFVQGYGGTVVRLFVLGSAATMFSLSAVLLRAGGHPSPSPFAYWYSLALLLIAAGLFGILIQSSRGSLVNWTGKAAQYLGGVYMLIAALAATRESDKNVTLGQAVSEARYRYGVAIAVVLAAAAVRMACLPSLGTPAAFIAFIPAVMLAALYGGLRPGLVSTGLSTLLASYLWIEPARQYSMENPVDLLSMAVFLAGGATISWIIEAMHRARARASAAEAEVRFAAERVQAAEVLRESENRERLLAAELQALLDAAPVAIWIAHDPECRRITGNAAADRLLQAPRSANISASAPPDEAAVAYKVLRNGAELRPEQLPAQVAVTGRPVLGDELELVFADGRSVHLVESAVPTFDADGRVRGAIIVGEDITERKQAEQQLKELNEILEKRVAERTAVAEVRAEQLRMLAQELTQAEQRERQRISHILHEHFQQLLVGAKFSLSTVQGRDAMSQEALRQADQVLAEAVEASRSLAVELSPPILHYGGLGPALGWLAQWMREKHGLIVEVLAEPHTPLPAEDIQTLLFQAARELLFNVIKHARVDRARVEVRQESGSMLRLSVIDAGIGFQADPFAPKAATAGGFGLFSIRERFSLLAGRVEIRSTPTTGTCVSLLVPLPASPQAAPSVATDPRCLADAPARRNGAGSAMPYGRRIRVLIADDHAIVRDGMTRLLLTQPDIEVVGQACDGRQAVAMAQQARPDVVIMDVSMPEMNGIEATRCIMAAVSDMRIIALSMHADQDVAEKMRRAGAAAYLAKSGPTDALLAAIRACVPQVTPPHTT